jgi:hypothetical protein
MSTTYVYSTHHAAKVTHIGTLERVECGFVFVSYFAFSDTPPEGRRVCAGCLAAIAWQDGAEERARARAELLAERRRAVQAERERLVTDAMLLGYDTNAAVARFLGMPLRVVVRCLAEAQRNAGARSRFEWGYEVGYQDGAASRWTQQ